MKYLAWPFAILLAVILLIYVSGEANKSAAEKLYARAHIIETKSEARQDLLAGLMPYVAISLSVIGGTVAIVAIGRSRPTSPHQTERIIETHTRTILVLQPGQHTRREIYKLLNGGDNG